MPTYLTKVPETVRQEDEIRVKNLANEKELIKECILMMKNLN
jgi:hypothetical protein